MRTGMQVMKPEWKWWPSALDIYPNQALVAKIDAPVLIMHVRSARCWAGMTYTGACTRLTLFACVGDGGRGGWHFSWPQAALSFAEAV